MEFKIGDRVKVKKYDSLPEEIKNKGLGKSAGKEGEIVDIMYSNVKDCFIYRIRFDGCAMHSQTDFLDGTFDIVPDKDKPTYEYGFEFLDNLVVARLYEIIGETKTEICKGHGHIFHDGVLGVAQASAYALKKILESLGGFVK
jgi:hypothetical protein